MRCFLFRQRVIRTLSAFVCALALVVGWGSIAAIAQTTDAPPARERATVAVDGNPLFSISASGDYTAQARAEFINLQLSNAVRSQESINVKVEQRNQLPTLLLNDRYLLTVTEKDTNPGISPESQAIVWEQQLEAAIVQAQAERKPEYIRQAILQAIILLTIVIVLHWSLGRLKRRFTQSLRRQLSDLAETPEQQHPSLPLEQFLTIVLAIARLSLWASAILYITNLFPFTRSWSYRVTNIILSTFTSPVLPLGKSAYSLIDLLLLSGFLAALVLCAGLFSDLVRSRVLTLAGINRGAQEVITILIKYGFITVGVLVILQIWGLDISSLTILASALGVGIGFGLQDIAKNFGSGLVLVFERPIQVGDFIEIGTSKGVVERIGGRSTEIRTLDHVTIIVPNSRFLAEEVINWSHGNPMSRLHLPVGVAYSAEPDAVVAALEEAARSHPDVLHEPPPQVFFKGFGDSALNFELLIWTLVPQRQFALQSDLYFRIFEILRSREIEIPFPQQDLHVRSANLDITPQLEALLARLTNADPNGDRPPTKNP